MGVRRRTPRRSRRAPRPVWVILRCVGRPVHTWRHDDSNPFRPEYCLYCRAPYHQTATPEAAARPLHYDDDHTAAVYSPLAPHR